MPKVAVVIPVYRELDQLEKISLDRCRKVLGRYPLVFVAPEGKIFSYFTRKDFVAEFPEEYFRSVKTYSKLMLSPQFYETFFDFDYILIYQLDAFVFYDALEEFCSLGYDYIGASWQYTIITRVKFSKLLNKVLRVGNGGFSLRKVKACHKALLDCKTSEKRLETVENISEDIFFALCGASENINFNIAPVEVANFFSMERYADRHVKRFGLPFGCHHWTKFSADFYVELFRRFGYDLRPFREQMCNGDYQTITIISTSLAMKRLLRKVESGRSLLSYLPTKNFASIRVIRSPEALEILSRLLTEENFLTDKIFVYDEENWTDLLGDVTKENLPHLIISAEYDVSLVAAVERQGLPYGEHVISFQCEYMKSCEEFFHGLGK